MSFLIPNAYADASSVTGSTAPGAAGLLSPENTSTEGQIVNTTFFMLFIFLAMYFIMIRPQQRKYKLHQAMVAGIKRGDEVVTSGGIVGKVTRVDDGGMVQVEIAKDVVVKVLASTITTIAGDDKPVNDNVAGNKK